MLSVEELAKGFLLFGAAGERELNAAYGSSGGGWSLVERGNGQRWGCAGETYPAGFVDVSEDTGGLCS